MYFLLVGVIINVSITEIISMSCDTEGGWLEYEGTCLKHYSNSLPWSTADATCIHFRQALLPTVDSPEINAFVQNNLTGGKDSWIGLSIPDISLPSWKWSDGSNTSSYDNWKTADVNSACAVMKYAKTEGCWFTSPCTNTTSYICEKERSNDNCSDWLRFDTHCYLVIQEPEETNMAAARICWQYDAYLISINSQTEADFINSNLEQNREYWIGLSPLKWVNDAPYQWNNWGFSGPTHNITEGCVFMYAISGKWFCGNCADILSTLWHNSYICQKDADSDIPTTSNVDLEVVTSVNTVFDESYTTIFDALDISTTQSTNGNSMQLLLRVILPSVCGGLVVIIVIIVVIIVVRRQKRSLTSKEAKSNEQAIYYNDIKKTRDNERVKTPDTHPTKVNETNRYFQTGEPQASMVGDTDRSTYEQLSQGPYVNSGQVTAGTYASLQ